jgi:hypothetical protein
LAKKRLDPLMVSNSWNTLSMFSGATVCNTEISVLMRRISSGSNWRNNSAPSDPPKPWKVS